MYQHQRGALARPTGSSSRFPSTPRYPYRPTGSSISFPPALRYSYRPTGPSSNLPPTPRYPYRAPTSWYSSGPYRPAPDTRPTRSTAGPQRSGTGTYRRLYPYTTPTARTSVRARPPVLSGSRSAQLGPSPPLQELGERYQGAVHRQSHLEAEVAVRPALTHRNFQKSKNQFIMIIFPAKVYENS